MVTSCPLEICLVLLFRHVVVSSLMVISVSVSRCQLGVKSFNHLSIVGICLATLIYRLPRCFVSLPIISRFNYFV